MKKLKNFHLKVVDKIKPYQLKNLNFIENEVIEKNKTIIYHLEIFTAVKIVYDIHATRVTKKRYKRC